VVAAALAVMSLLAVAKRRAGRALGNRTLMADSARLPVLGHAALYVAMTMLTRLRVPAPAGHPRGGHLAADPAAARGGAGPVAAPGAGTGGLRHRGRALNLVPARAAA
jgi:hypothetical protein